MKIFKFRYQTLLEVRQRAQQQEEQRLQQLAAQQHEAQTALAGLFDEEAAQRQAWLSSQDAGTLDLDGVVMIQQFLYVLDTRIQAQRRSVDEAEARVANQREMLTDAMRQTEIIQQLKDRDFKAWRDAIEKAEAAELDEMATLRYASIQLRSGRPG